MQVVDPVDSEEDPVDSEEDPEDSEEDLGATLAPAAASSAVGVNRPLMQQTRSSSAQSASSFPASPSQMRYPRACICRSPPAAAPHEPPQLSRHFSIVSTPKDAARDWRASVLFSLASCPPYF